MDHSIAPVGNRRTGNRMGLAAGEKFFLSSLPDGNRRADCFYALGRRMVLGATLCVADFAADGGRNDRRRSCGAEKGGMGCVMGADCRGGADVFYHRCDEFIRPE